MLPPDLSCRPLHPSLSRFESPVFFGFVLPDVRVTPAGSRAVVPSPRLIAYMCWKLDMTTSIVYNRLTPRERRLGLVSMLLTVLPSTRRRTITLSRSGSSLRRQVALSTSPHQQPHQSSRKQSMQSSQHILSVCLTFLSRQFPCFVQERAVWSMESEGKECQLALIKGQKW